MDWITGLQRAIDYIEETLLDQTDYGAIAKRAYCSGFHFQRLFSLLCGCTVGEYIRSRRLALAAQELSASGAKVIDIALKYGYETPESFAKAFSRFHGVTPSAARKPGASLKAFARLSIKLSLEGASMIEYRIESKDAFDVVARTERFADQAGENAQKIPAFWSRCHADGTVKRLFEQVGDSGLFGRAVLGMCIADSDVNTGEFSYGIGGQHMGGDVAPGYIVSRVPARTWAIFTCRGAMPKAMQELWRAIFTEFFPGAEWEPMQDIDFEVYPEGDMDGPDYVSEIWIPVRRK